MKQRVLTSLVLVPLVLIDCSINWPYPLALTCLVVATIGFGELRDMLHGEKTLPILTLAGIVLPFFAIEVQHNRSPIQILLWELVFFAVGLVAVFFAVRQSRASNAGVDLAGLWISAPLACLATMHSRIFSWSQAPNSFGFAWSESPLLCVLGAVWAADIAAYAVGKSFGNHLLWPKVSPKKTVEGAIAGVAASLAISAGLWHLLKCSKPGPWYVGGAVLGVSCVLGDLFESWIKRREGVKDSGSILPGHGGLLDRIDSLLFAGPSAALLLIIWPN